jgi:hypothetical protein
MSKYTDMHTLAMSTSYRLHLMQSVGEAIAAPFLEATSALSSSKSLSILTMRCGMTVPHQLPDSHDCSASQATRPRMGGVPESPRDPPCIH